MYEPANERTTQREPERLGSSYEADRYRGSRSDSPARRGPERLSDRPRKRDDRSISPRNCDRSYGGRDAARTEEQEKRDREKVREAEKKQKKAEAERQEAERLEAAKQQQADRRKREDAAKRADKARVQRTERTSLRTEQKIAAAGKQHSSALPFFTHILTIHSEAARSCEREEASGRRATSAGQDAGAAARSRRMEADQAC